MADEEEDVATIYVGIDWGSEQHQVCVLDPRRRVLLERAFGHSGSALEELAQTLLRLGDNDPGRIAVAIEVPRGAIVETLLDKDIAVFSINPKQLDRFRDRHTVSGAKDDRRDAWCSQTRCAPIGQRFAVLGSGIRCSYSCAS